MIEFSTSLASRKLPTIVSSEDDLNVLMDTFQHVVKDLNLWQYYVLDVAREKASVASILSSNKMEPWIGPDVSGKPVVELAQIVHSSGMIRGLRQLASRFGVCVDAGYASGLVKAAFGDLGSTDALVEAWGRVVDVINVPLYEEWEADTKAALDNVRNRVRYTRLELKQGEINKEFV
jgi:glycogen debranching enzyme